MNNQNREAFLNQIAKKLRRPRRTEPVIKPRWNYAPQVEVLAEATTEELIEVLKQQCEVIHTDYKQATKANLSLVLQEVISEYEGNSLIITSDQRHADYGLTDLYDRLKTNGTDVHIWNDAIGKENQIIAERADVGITFSDITLAESGTVALFNDKNKGRSISLLPKTFIAIIPKETIVARLTQATGTIHNMIKAEEEIPSCISFVTGPSNSADIEMKLIVGVHGPIKATYIVVE